MALRIRKSEIITVGTTGGTGTGTARTTIGLGAAVAKVLGFEFKGITGSDGSVTLRLRDADGRAVYRATSLAPYTDDSTNRKTEQGTSTKGVLVLLQGAVAADIATVSDVANEAATAAGRAAVGILAKGPITVDITTGTDGETCRVNLLVETGEDRR
jgi:hypothetical protein